MNGGTAARNTAQLKFHRRNPKTTKHDYYIGSPTLIHPDTPQTFTPKMMKNDKNKFILLNIHLYLYY